MSTGENIKKARKAAGLTQKELGERMGIKAGTVSAFEKDRTYAKLSTLEKFADALDIPITDLLDDDTMYNMTFKTIIEKKNNLMKAVVKPSATVADALQSIDWDKQRKISLDTYYESLNTKGQIEAVKRVEELTYIPDYMDDEE